MKDFKFAARNSSEDTDSTKPAARHAIRQAAAMLCGSGKVWPGHILFISACSFGRVSMPLIDENISVHTMSPARRFEFENGTPRGWHVFSDIGSHGPSRRVGELVLRNRTRKMMQHIRMGIDSGVAAKLQIHLAVPDGCLVRRVWRDTNLDVARPGESWVIPLQIELCAVNDMRPDGYKVGVCRGPLEIGHLVNEIDKALGILSDDCEFSQGVLWVSLEYKSSALGDQSTVRVESCCTVMRCEGRYLHLQMPHNGLSTASQLAVQEDSNHGTGEDGYEGEEDDECEEHEAVEDN